jgi:hypothetical protein
LRLNVPLLPVMVEVRWRPLGPPRISLYRLMLAVAVIAIFFSLWAYLGRVNRAIDYHNEQARKAAGNPFTYGPLAAEPGDVAAMNWHTAMASEYHDTFMRLDLIVLLFGVAIAGVCVCALVGRFLNVFARRSLTSVGDDLDRIT